MYIGIQTVLRGVAGARLGVGLDWQLALVSSLLDATCASWFAAVGASIGSFLNVVAYRLPLHRTVGGHSACPYCTMAIAGRDNIPVLAWIKLRGRCRHCRLPISIQYPMVELAVGVIFLVVYFSEFATGGANLPGSRLAGSASHLLHVGLTGAFIGRLVVYLFALSGLLAAALIAIKRRVVPMKLYLWSLGPLVAAALIEPEILIVRWRTVEPVGGLEARLDAITTILCGLVAGVAVARTLAPLVYRGFDRSLMASDPASIGARQFVGALAVAGATVGWQAVVPLSWCLLLWGLLSLILLRQTPYKLVGLGLEDLTVWVWLGLLVFRAGWSTWDRGLDLWPFPTPPVVNYLLATLLLAPVAMLYRRQAQLLVRQSERQPQDGTSQPLDEPQASSS